MDRLPEPQRRALGVAFGMVSGPPADPFLVGLAVLTLLSDAAEVRPVLCVIDDAQWLDEESAGVLIFVARRLLADRVGLLFAVRETVDPDPRLQALPGLRISGLPKPDAHEVLETSISRPIDPVVAARIIAETGGNPLAVVEAARGLTQRATGRAGSAAGAAARRRPDRGILSAARCENCLRIRTRCCCWRRQAHRGGNRSCGRRPRRSASPSPPPFPPSPPDWRSSGRRCGSSTRLSGQRSTTPPPRPSGARLTARWRRPAIRSSTRCPAPGISLRRPCGPTRRSRPSWRRQRAGPGAVVATPPPQRC